MRHLLDFLVCYLTAGIIFYLWQRKLIAQAIKEVAVEQDMNEGFLKLWMPVLVVILWPFIYFIK